MTGDRSRTGRRWPLLALPVVCCVGHVVLIAAGVGSLAAVTGAVTASVAVASAGVLLLAGVVVVVLLRRLRRAAAPADLADPAAHAPAGGPR